MNWIRDGIEIETMTAARDYLGSDDGMPFVRPGDLLTRAEALMRAYDVRELPVVTHEGVLAGILTQADMQPYRGHFEWTPVDRAMSVDVVTVQPATPITLVAALMIDRRINAIPVVADGRFVGLLRRTDLLRRIAGRT